MSLGQTNRIRICFKIKSRIRIKSKLRNCGGSKWSNKGLWTLVVQALRLKTGPGIRGGSVDQWSQICITLLRSRIRIRIQVRDKVTRWIRMRSRIRVCIKVKSRIRIEIQSKGRKRDPDPHHSVSFESATMVNVTVVFSPKLFSS